MKRKSAKTEIKEQPVMTAIAYARLHGLNYRTLCRWIAQGEKVKCGAKPGPTVKFPSIRLSNGKYLIAQGAFEQFAASLQAAAGGNGPTTAQARA